MGRYCSMPFTVYERDTTGFYNFSPSRSIPLPSRSVPSRPVLFLSDHNTAHAWTTVRGSTLVGSSLAQIFYTKAVVGAQCGRCSFYYSSTYFSITVSYARKILEVRLKTSQFFTLVVSCDEP